MPVPIKLLTELGDLLERYGPDGCASHVRSLLDGRPASAVWSDLSGVSFWGGAGAVWEVEPFQYSHPESRQAGGDYRRFQTLMIELAKMLDDRGLGRMSDPIAALFRRTLDEGGPT